MSRADIIFTISGLATVVQAGVAAIAASGEFAPDVIAIAAVVGAMCAALVTFISRPTS